MQQHSSKRQKTVIASAAADGASTLPGAPRVPKRNLAAKMVDFLNDSWTPYHCVEEATKRLTAAGFQHISEKDPWSIQPGGKYFFTRNFSTIVAFAVGANFKPGNGFYMVGAHTDSPCLKLRPVSKSTKSGYLMVGVETYGGGLWTTWFDRDLGLAGRVLVRDPSTGAIRGRLVRIDKPILRIPMLAIHLQRDINTAGFKPNLQTNLAPVLATSIQDQLNKPAAAPAANGAPAPTAAASATPAPEAAPATEAAAAAAAAAPAAAAGAAAEAAPAGTDPTAKHHSTLMELVSNAAGCRPEEIVDFELHLCDVQPGVIGGARDEFVFCGRLDNLAMSFLALQSLIDACSAEDALAAESGVRCIALFDHEEVGSDSAQGAGGPVMRDTVRRVAGALSQGEEGAVERSLLASFLISADMAHALHPNYADKHEPEHQPRFHEGLVVKHNANQRYATNAVSAALFREVGRLRGVPCQEFSVRNDTPCGSTIGPILASLLGCRTVDVGIAQLSMHSIREMCGTDDVDIAYAHFVAFFEDISKLDRSLDVETLQPPNPRGTLRDVSCMHTHGSKSG